MDYCTKLSDKVAYLQVLGNLMNHPDLLSDINRPITKADFNTEPLYEIIFVSISNLFLSGVKIIDEVVLDQYIMAKKEWAEYYKDNGLDYIVSCRDLCEAENYEYWYHRLRKFSLLRYYEDHNIDTRFIYDADKADIDADEQLKLDNLTEQDIVGMIEDIAVVKPNMEYCTNVLSVDQTAGYGMKKLIESLREVPDFGAPLMSPMLTTLARGFRIHSLMMVSAPQGQGKSRYLAANACKVGVPYMYDLKQKKWVYTGLSEPTLFIVTELDIDEAQTILNSIVSKVNEEHIKLGEYEEGEYERVVQAAEYIEAAPLYICHLPDFSIEDVKNVIKRYKREFGVNFIFFDYIFSTLRLMSEVNKNLKVALKEYQLLLLFSSELKSLCQSLDVCIFTASQVNGEINTATVKDQNVLSGSKALANKIDCGFVLSEPSPSELKKIDNIVRNRMNSKSPNMCQHVYKLRSGRLSRVIIWSYCDRGNMYWEDLFATTYNYELIDVDLTIMEDSDVVEEEIKKNSISMTEVKDITVEEIEEDEEETTTPKFDW